MIVESLNVLYSIVSPTLDLVDQWREKLKTFNIRIEELKGKKRVKSNNCLRLRLYLYSYK